MARRCVDITKLGVVQKATGMFLQQGYLTTSIKAIADSLNMNTGYLTFYFPAKEHLLAELVDMLCNFRWAQLKSCFAENNGGE